MARKPAQISDEEIASDEEVIINNFGKYIEPLVRQWLWIAVCAVGLGILALAYSKFTNHFSPSYQASALVASAQTESSVDFGSAIKTVSDVQLAGQIYTSTLYDRAARVQSFIAQIHNGAIAEQVLKEIGPMLNSNREEPITATGLQGLVSAELVPKTDTIAISASYDDPVLAAEIANAWGKAYVQWINELYSLSGKSSLAIEANAAQAKMDYDKAEAALEDFIARDKTAEYKRQVDEITTIISYLGNGRSAVGIGQVSDHLVQLDQAYADSRQIGLFLDNAVSMRAAVSAGGESAAISNALALTMLKTQIYAAFAGSNTLQVQNLPEALGSNISTINAAGMVADLDALISTLETRLTELDKLIGTISIQAQNEDYLMNYSTANTPIELKILENEQKIRDLNSLITAQTSTLDELSKVRDLAWESYSALATKVTEMRVNPQDIQLAFASSATPPASPSGGFSTALATGVGLLIGIIVAYAYEFWQTYKGRKPEMITREIYTYSKQLVSRRRSQS